MFTTVFFDKRQLIKILRNKITSKLHAILFGWLVVTFEAKSEFQVRKI